MKKFLINIKHQFSTACEQITAILRILVNTKSDVEVVQKGVDRVLNLMVEQKKLSELPILTIARHSLGTIDLQDIKDPTPANDDEYSEYVARIFAAHGLVTKELEQIMKLQHDYWFTQAPGWEQTLFGRGTMNGIQLVLDRFNQLKDIHIERTRRKEEPPIGSREEILGKLQVEGSDNLSDEMDKR